MVGFNRIEQEIGLIQRVFSFLSNRQVLRCVGCSQSIAAAVSIEALCRVRRVFTAREGEQARHLLRALIVRREYHVAAGRDHTAVSDGDRIWTFGRHDNRPSQLGGDMKWISSAQAVTRPAQGIRFQGQSAGAKVLALDAGYSHTAAIIRGGCTCVAGRNVEVYKWGDLNNDDPQHVDYSRKGRIKQSYVISDSPGFIMDEDPPDPPAVEAAAQLLRDCEGTLEKGIEIMRESLQMGHPSLSAAALAEINDFHKQEMQEAKHALQVAREAVSSPESMRMSKFFGQANDKWSECEGIACSSWEAALHLVMSKYADQDQFKRKEPMSEAGVYNVLPDAIPIGTVNHIACIAESYAHPMHDHTSYARRLAFVTTADSALVLAEAPGGVHPTPWTITRPLAGHRVVQVQAKRTYDEMAYEPGHLVVLTDTGALFTQGRNINGQLGLGHREASDSLHRVEHGLPPVLEVAAGQAHTLALCRDGSVWSWGDGSLGQLGHGTTDDELKPRMVCELAPSGGEGWRTVKVAAGCHHSVALVAGLGKWHGWDFVYTWGQGRYGQLGHGTLEAETLPRCIASSMANGDRGWLPRLCGDGGRFYSSFSFIAGD